MAYLNTTRSLSVGQSLFGNLFATIGSSVARYKLYSKTLGELRQLSDRELNDLGLSRSSIISVARAAAYGK